MNGVQQQAERHRARGAEATERRHSSSAVQSRTSFSVSSPALMHASTSGTVTAADMIKREKNQESPEERRRAGARASESAAVELHACCPVPAQPVAHAQASCCLTGARSVWEAGE